MTTLDVVLVGVFVLGFGVVLVLFLLAMLDYIFSWRGAREQPHQEEQE